MTKADFTLSRGEKLVWAIPVTRRYSHLHHEIFLPAHQRTWPFVCRSFRARAGGGVAGGMKSVIKGKIWAGVVLLGLVGCRHRSIEPTGIGASSFAIVSMQPTASDKVAVGEAVDAGEPGASKVSYVEEFVQARPLPPIMQPVYPPQALKAKAGRAVVGVRVMVDEKGRVTDIGPSLLTFSTFGPYAGAFRGAVESAVWQWRFAPAELLQVERVQKDGSAYQRVIRRQAVSTQIDLAFTFTESGGVEAGK